MGKRDLSEMIETQDKQETNENMNWSASSKQIETILEEAKKDRATDEECA